MRPRLAFVVATISVGCSFVESFDGYSGGGDSPDASDAQGATIDVALEDTLATHDTAHDTFVATESNVDDSTLDSTIDAPIDSTPPCTLTTCGTSCVDTNSDPSNCGGCGNVVDPSEYCVDGSPTCRPNTWTCTPWVYAGSTVACEYKCTDHLGDGSHCVSPSDPGHVYRCYLGSGVDGYCVDGSCTTAGCGSLTACVSTLSNVFSCYDTQRDSNHCGTCDNRCAPSETCAAAGCHRYRVVAACSACGGGEKCSTAQSGWAYSTFCIEGSACPDD